MELLTSQNNQSKDHSGGFADCEMKTVSPNIYVRDIEQTMAFYQMLGFETTTMVPGEGKPVFALMRSGNVVFMFQTFESIENALPAVSRMDGGSLLLYITMKGIRAFYEKIKDGVAVLNGLEKTFYGATEFSILDINNYVITFAEDE